MLQTTCCKCGFFHVSKKLKNEKKETIINFEKQTGIILKYIVYEHSYDFREYTKLGSYPDSKINVKDGIDYQEFIKSYLDNWLFHSFYNLSHLYVIRYNKGL